MPGTIQVSVLDFQGLHSSSASSQISVKVSMGKREYKTWEKGEFSFPLTTLRDNLIITLEDAEGNEISHTGVETRLVVEKGVWDDIFSLEGGGHVHMKLHFILSEEERQRIQIMRESAVKKKLDELCNSGHGSPKSASVGYNEGNTSAKSMPEAVNVHLTELCLQDSVLSELEKPNNSKKKGAAGKANSDVRKMISAFEGSLNQDVKPSIKPPPQTKKIGMDFFLTNSRLNEVETEKATLGRTNSKEFEQSIREKVEPIGFVGEEKEEQKYSKDFETASTIEKAAFSGRVLDKHSIGNQSWKLFSKMRHSCTSLLTKEGGEEIFHKDPREAERTSNEKLKSMVFWRDDHSSFGSSGLWIFPGEAKCLCITTGGKQIMDLMGGFWDEINTQQRKLSACVPKNTEEVNTDAGTAIEANEDGQISKKLRPKAKNSMDPEDSIGPVGQVIRVVIIVGFATLVLLTRKRR